jgi:hypothetical protein
MGCPKTAFLSCINFPGSGAGFLPAKLKVAFRHLYRRLETTATSIGSMWLLTCYDISTLE